MSGAWTVLALLGVAFWIAVSAWLLTGLSHLPKSERAAADWLIFGLWPVTLPLLLLYDFLTWARRRWVIRKGRNNG